MLAAWLIKDIGAARRFKNRGGRRR